MDIPFSRWYPAIIKRRSRRSFDASHPVETDKLLALDRICKQFTPFPSARSQLVIESVQDVFKGVFGNYGKIKGACAFIAFIGDMHAPSVQEDVGYTGEGIILEATALGLDTCWVAGLFKREVVTSLVEIKNNEQILAVTPVGYAHRFESTEEKLMTGFGRTHQRLSISRLLSKTCRDNFPEWIEASIQAARLAPSAINRQPWGFDVKDGNIMIYVRTSGPELGVSKRLDCGIAMLHIEIAAMNCGVIGKWQILEDKQIARFSTTER